MTHSIADTHELVAAARRIVVLAGAGMSTGSGIPDFRGPDGLWTKDPDEERISTLSWYLGDEVVRRKAWQYRLHSPIWTSMPNAAHAALVSLERQGRLSAIVTQNTDGLQQIAGSTPRLVLEVHGNVRTYRCERCGVEGNTVDLVDRVRDGEEDPRCLRPLREFDDTAPEGAPCNGVLRATTILFEEALPVDVIEAGIEAVSQCDCLIAVGTSLTVYPVAGLVPLAKRCGAALVIVNGEETPYDSLADAVVRGRVEEVLPEIVRP